MEHILPLFEQPVAQCIGLVLIHFVWQGALVAVWLAGALRLMRHRSANARYVTAVLGFAVMGLLPIVTILTVELPEGPVYAARQVGPLPFETKDTGEREKSLTITDVHDSTALQDPDVESPVGPVDLTPVPGNRNSELTAQRPARQRPFYWMSDAARKRLLALGLPWVVLAWMIGVSLLSLRLAGSWFQVSRLRRQGIQPVHEAVRHTVERLSEQLGARRSVVVLESALAKVPCLIGILRPTILLPASALTGLSPEQLESILAHELAHVRRHDCLIATIQAFVEILLFYHPGVWWVSRQIRIERENCCDDLALAIVKSRMLYVQALADMAQLVAARNQLSAAANGTDLLPRIRRIVGASREVPSRSTSWWAGALMLVVLTTLMVVVSSKSTLRLARAEDSESMANDSNRNDMGATVARNTGQDNLQFRLYDEFDGKLQLDWEVIRPDPTHVSLEKNPGKLTIASQHGGLHSDEGKRTPGPQVNNLYLVANPAGDGDFVVTTCLDNFHPKERYQQAGPIVYDDDNNYFKALVGYGNSDVLFGSSWESRSDFWGFDLSTHGMEWKRVWLRITKRGNAYEAAYSLNGKDYTVLNEHVWGDGSPSRIGLAVMNEDGTHGSVDAAFDFCEIRALTAEERDDPAYHERQKFRGVWETSPASASNAPASSRHFTRFSFNGSTATITERQNSLFSEFSVNPESVPKQLSLFRAGTGAINAAYRFEDQQLIVCMNTRPDLPAPTEFESGNGRVLVRLQRTPEVVVKAIERYRFWGTKRYQMLDENRDDRVTLEEFLYDFPAPTATQQGTRLFAMIDQDNDNQISLDEFKNWPRETLVMRFDLDADGGLSEREFMRGDVPTASLTRARKAFRLTDQDGDGLVSTTEFFFRSPEAWYAKLDENEDEGVSYVEYAAHNESLVRKNRCRVVFDEIDTDANGSLSRDEYLSKGPRFTFLKVEASGNGDGKMSLDEFISLKRSENTEAVKTEFAEKDLDSNGVLTIEEYAPPTPLKTENEAEDSEE